ncbi:MAG TPA: protoporphyrinogen oxidase [Gemmataceae bacterium]|nr:protoporphyrinogen oxidase [Gemmataceae bacterium]
MRVVIVGAGISGLALAYRLNEFLPSAQITILEQQNRPGGTIWTEQRDGFQVEIGPNGFLDNKPSTLALCRDLGLADRLVPAAEAAERNRYLFLDGRLRRLPNSIGSFLRSDLLSWRGKLSILLERWRPRPSAASDESIDAFVRRRAGNEVAEVLADAMVTGIYAGDPTRLSVRAAFPRLVALEEQYGSVLKGMSGAARERRAEAAARGERYRSAGRMWSFAEGLRLAIETLCERLPNKPLLGVAAQRLQRAPAADGQGTVWTVIGEGQDRWLADAVVLTCPTPQQAAVLADLDSELAHTLSAIPYCRIAVIALGYRHSDVPIALDGFGFIVPQRTRRDLLGVQWCSSIFPDRAPPGRVLLRGMCGGWNRPEVVDWDDTQLLRAVRADLHSAMGIAAEPVFHHIVRWDRAIPQYHLGHLDRVAWIEERAARYPGLFLGGNAYHGVALNDCTEQAVILAERLRRYLTRFAAS